MPCVVQSVYFFGSVWTNYTNKINCVALNIQDKFLEFPDARNN